MSLYLLSQPSDKFSALISPLLDPKAIQNTAVVILLDWSTPHLWMGELARWVSLFKSVTQKLDHAEHGEMEEVMDGWKMRGRGGSSTNLDGTPSAAATGGDGDSTLPLGQGEWSEPLGLPLCVVCQNVSSTVPSIEILDANYLPPSHNVWKCWKRIKAGPKATLIRCCSTCELFFYAVCIDLRDITSSPSANQRVQMAPL